ncbi:MAG: ribulose-phosphate 3-epimerase [bacterium]
MKKIAASILSADFTRLGEEIAAVEKAGSDWLHVDVMDGHFVPNLTLGPPVIERIKKVAKIPLDVHLMILHADLFLQDYVSAGADILTVHVEACPHLHRTLTQIRKLGARPAVALNPHTPLDAMGYVLNEVDMVLLMSVNPGFGGQSFIGNALKKAEELRKIREEHKLNFLIQMDGGIKVDNIAQVSRAGVDVFVVGSGIFQTPSYAETIAKLKQNAS